MSLGYLIFGQELVEKKPNSSLLLDPGKRR